MAHCTPVLLITYFCSNMSLSKDRPCPCKFLFLLLFFFYTHSHATQNYKSSFFLLLSPFQSLFILCLLMEVERVDIHKSRLDRRDDPDLPPESIVIPISDDYSWPELSPVYDREDSTKGSTNPKSHSNPFPWSKSRSGSTRVAATNLNPTASTPIISLPTKIQRRGFIYCRRPPPIFPKWRNSGSKKSGLPECEPGSPKVSCIGKVLSEREREKRRRKEEERKERGNESNRAGCWNRFSAILHCAGGGSRNTEECRKKLEDVRPSSEVEEQRPSPVATKGRRSPEKAELEAAEEVVVVAPAIGAMKKFSSGRRAAQWGDDVVEANT